MQTRQTAAAQEDASGSERPEPSANPEVLLAAGVRRRRIGMTGPGERRVPSLAALRGAARHSRIVRTMRVILPALALLVVGLVALQAFRYKADDTLKLSFVSGTLPDDPKMLSPELSFPFGKGNLFRARARSAWRDEAAPSRVNMNDIQAEITVGHDSWVSLSAVKGVLDTKAKQVILGPGINISSNTGYELQTEAAVFDTRTGAVTGQSAVTAQGPLGTLRCDGFSVSGEGSRIRCEGNVRMTLARPLSPSG